MLPNPKRIRFLSKTDPESSSSDRPPSANAPSSPVTASFTFPPFSLLLPFNFSRIVYLCGEILLTFYFVDAEYRIDICWFWRCIWFGFGSKCSWVCFQWIILCNWLFMIYVFEFLWLCNLVMGLLIGGLLTINTIRLMLLFGWLIFMTDFLSTMFLGLIKWLLWWWSLTWMMLVSLHSFWPR